MESVILDVISAALTGIAKNNERDNRSLFIFLRLDNYEYL
jgi:hypothetical protein